MGFTPRYGIIHHTAAKFGNAASVRDLHTRPKSQGGQGWDDIAYHWLICNGHGGPDGEIQPGRPADRKGAGVWGRNGDAWHAVLVGNFEKGHPTYSGLPSKAQLNSLGALMLKRWRPAGITPERVKGHKEHALIGHGTACPGNQFPTERVLEWYRRALASAAAVEPLGEFIYGGAPVLRLIIDGVDVTAAARPRQEKAPTGGLVTFLDGPLRSICEAMGWAIGVDETGAVVVRTRG